MQRRGGETSSDPAHVVAGEVTLKHLDPLRLKYRDELGMPRRRGDCVFKAACRIKGCHRLLQTMLKGANGTDGILRFWCINQGGVSDAGSVDKGGAPRVQEVSVVYREGGMVGLRVVLIQK